MLADNSKEVQSGRLDRELHLPAEAKLHLMEFIAQELPRWRDHPDRPDKESEAALTEHLCDYLNGATHGSSDWSHVQFRTETGDETRGGRKIDLAVKPCGVVINIENRRHSQFDALFPIECKRLPTPKEKDRDERDYVTNEPGTTGGIQRFKFGHHGAVHKFAGMIAYVQALTFDHWLGQVNGWIRALAAEADSGWNQLDQVHLSTGGPHEGVCMLNSRHQRSGVLGELELRHLWVSMN